jgi:Asp-tRNA(Asn)/Glu-tRNA(Gln) amidotransferase A subunit family amidase
MVPLALGSQTAGSIIRPASYCGVMGFKPSFGLIPRTGVLKTTDTLDTIGFVGRSINDLQLMFEVVRVRGHNYPLSEAALNDPARCKPADRPWRVGLVEVNTDAHIAPLVRKRLSSLANRLAGAGFVVERGVLPPVFANAHDIHETVYRRALAYYFETEWKYARDKFSARMTPMIEGGLAITPDQYYEAIGQQRALSRVFDEFSKGFDILLTASTADEAPVGMDPAEPPDSCLIWTMCGAPTISLPLLSGSTGLPVGAQVVARRYSDYVLLDAARALLAAAV